MMEIGDFSRFPLTCECGAHRGNLVADMGPGRAFRRPLQAIAQLPRRLVQAVDKEPGRGRQGVTIGVARRDPGHWQGFYDGDGLQALRVFRAAFAVERVIEVIKGAYADRVSFCHGDTPIAPGIETALIGGHTDGLQVVRVHMRRGWVVLASDASHCYENMDAEMPYPIVFHVGDMVAGWDKVRALADSAQHVVPGLPEELRGEVVRLREAPAW